MYKPKALRVFFCNFLPALALIVCISIFAGCSKKPEKSLPKKINQTKKEPKSLKQLEESIETVTKDFEKTFIKQTAPPEPSASSQESENSKKRSSSNSKENKQGKSKEQSQEKTLKSEEQKTKREQIHNWNKTEKDISKIHQLWNEFQLEATKRGISSDSIEVFSDNLNELTTTLTEKELFRGLILANDLYEKTVSFAKFYGKGSSDLKRVLYLGRDATYKALNKMPDAESSSIEKALEVWDISKAQIKDTDMIGKVDHSLKELLTAIKKQDPNLIKIKAEIGEKNIKGAIKFVEKNK